MVEQLKRPNLFKSKSFSFQRNDGRWNENLTSDEKIHNSPEMSSLNMRADDTYMNQNHVGRRVKRKGSSHPANEQSNCESGSLTSARSPLNNLRHVHSCHDEDHPREDPISVRVPMKRRKSFMPMTSHSRSSMNSCDTMRGYPRKAFQAACPVFELDDENDEDVTVAQQLPTRQRTSFMQSALRGVSLSPKPAFQKQTISSLQRKGKPPLLRTLSYNASIDTFNYETEHSNNTRSTASSPTSSSDLQQDEQSLESVLDGTSNACVSLMETNKVVNFFDLDKSNRSIKSPDVCDAGGWCKKKEETNMSFVRSISLIIGMFLWHHLKLIGLTLNLKTIIFRIWMTLFDIVIEAFSITVELISYAIPIALRIFETSMLWFVQQVHIRRLFIFLFDTFKHRKSIDVVVGTIDETPTSESISNPIEKSNRRPIRFLCISKDNVRRKGIRVGNLKD